MNLIKRFPCVIAVCIIILVWQMIAMKINYPAIIPTIPELFRQIWDLLNSGEFLPAILSTLLRGIFGFIAAFILAFILATASAFSTFWKLFFHPIIVITRSIPVISFVLLALLWLSPDGIPVFIALLTMFPILYQNILTGFEQTDKKWIEMAHVFGNSPWSCFLRIYLPASKSVIFDGVSTALGFGWRAIIIGEVLAQPLHGIGSAMKQAQAFINVSELIAWTVFTIGISYLLDLFIKQIRKIRVIGKLPGPDDFRLIQNNQVTDKNPIKLLNIKKEFNGFPIFNEMNYTFHAHSITCLKGPSGKGKTTLLRLIAGIEKPDNGFVEISEKQSIAYAFQDFRLLPWLSVTENVAFATHTRLKKQEASNIAKFLLDNMELGEHCHKFPNELSGGQQQRVALARALAAQSDILLLDEPLTGLDEELKIRILDFLSKWLRIYKPTVIWATHQEINFPEIEVSELLI